MPDSEEITRKLTRKSGGQPENWNAFKHGFYSRRYKPLELSDLDTALVDGLVDEIALLRAIIRRCRCNHRRHRPRYRG